jgi:hypothetical protein
LVDGPIYAGVDLPDIPFEKTKGTETQISILAGCRIVPRKPESLERRNSRLLKFDTVVQWVREDQAKLKSHQIKA